MLGAAAIGALDALRLRSPGIAAAAIPVFALTGLLIGLVVVAAERASRDRPWWQAALAIAAPSLIVAVPVSASLFKGAYARTLPLSTAAPVVLPLLAWLGAAVAIAAGRRLLRATDLTTRAIAVICVAGAIGGLILGERRILQTGYPTAHLGATLAVCALAGVAPR